MAIKVPTEEFTIDEVGDVTDHHYVGSFKCFPHLPHRLQMEENRLFRLYLGEHPHLADVKTIEKAMTFANLDVSIVDAPRWWGDTDSGKGLHDDNVVAKVKAGVAKIQNVFDENLKKKQDAAKKELAAVEDEEK